MPDSLLAPERSPEAVILDAARAGSVDALGSLLETARRQLLAAAAARIPCAIRHKVGASDIVQQTALDAHRGFAQFNGSSPAEFFGWLREILETNVVDSVRRYELAKKRDVARERSLDHPTARMWADAIPPSTRRPDDSAVRREEMRAVERALDELTPDQRAVVWMRHWEGKSFAEICRRIGASDAAVRKIWFRGIRRLGEVIHGLPAFADEAAAGNPTPPR